MMVCVVLMEQGSYTSNNVSNGPILASGGSFNFSSSHLFCLGSKEQITSSSHDFDRNKVTYLEGSPNPFVDYIETNTNISIVFEYRITHVNVQIVQTAKLINNRIRPED